MLSKTRITPDIHYI